jgi:hypothetical protein
MGLLNNLTRQLIDRIKGVSNTASTPTNTNLNSSPRYADINKPRTAQFSGANVNSNNYANSQKSPVMFALKEGGKVLARGNKLAKHRPTKLY